MKVFVPYDVKYIINELYKNKFDAFIVGGCLRDLLLNLEPKDYDIATSAKPDNVMSLFNKTIPTGIKHGTVSVVINNNNYEVTTFRTEGDYLDNRHPSSVDFVTDIREDLSRRDFTVNALAYNDKLGLIDYFNGINDLKNKIIRCVGHADKRFKEDALRMLRAIRFSCQLGFKIENKTFEAIINNANLIKNISKERIRDELCKILISSSPSKGIDMLQKTGLLEFIIPELNLLVNYSPLSIKHNRDVFGHTLKVMDNLEGNNLTLMLAALLHDVGKLNTLTLEADGVYRFPKHNIEGSVMSKKILRDLKFDNYTVNSVSKLIEHHLVLQVNYMPTRYEIKKYLLEVGEDIVYLLFELQKADIRAIDNPKPGLNTVEYIKDTVKDILSNKEPLYIKDLVINGEDLIKEFNIPRGKLIGDILNHLLDEVLKNPDLNNKENLLSLSRNFLNHN